MSFTFPQFQVKAPIDATRSWTATFDSYDQRNEDCYYVVTTYDGEREAAKFYVQVGLWWAGEDWTGPDFVERLRKEIHTVAAQGKANTDYRGSVFAP